ncbi:hypothetical protein J3R83DRAFT_3986 [Lanmaoa asiatica]|nr:hypothetical protein J3R83DRAFT_3986 [Lanmaoa asiatica]
MDLSVICQGGKGTCNCEEFYPSNENNCICLECGHGISKHHREATARPPDPLPLGPPPNPLTSASSSAVDIFCDIAGQQLFSTDRDRKPLVSIAKAKAEALAMLLSKKHADDFKLVRQPASLTGIPHKRNGNLRQLRSPHGKTAPSEIQALKNCGCYITASSTKGIPIDSAWTFMDVDKKMRKWFPNIFQYIELIKPPFCSQTQHLPFTQSSDPKPPNWCIIIKQGVTFAMLEVLYPNGSTLVENKGQSKASVMDSHLWFGV